MRRLGLLMGLLLLPACTGNLQNLQNIGKESDPSRFYSLAANTKAEGTAVSSVQVIGIGPVSVADYLDRSQIVTRKSATEMELAEFDRWAGKLDREIQRTLVADIAQSTGSQSVITHPWKSAVTPDASVEITIDRFERDVDGKAKLSATWQVYGRDDRAPLSFHRTELTKESGAGYDQLASSLSELVGQLSAEIIAALPAK